MSNANIISKLQEEIEVLDRHLKILRIILEKGPIGIIKLSEITGVPTHKVRYSLRVLEKYMLILPSSNGAIITDDASQFIDDFKVILREMTEKLKGLEDTLSEPL